MIISGLVIGKRGIRAPLSILASTDSSDCSQLSFAFGKNLHSKQSKKENVAKPLPFLAFFRILFF